MNLQSDRTQIDKAVSRHVGVSVVAAAAAIVLAVFGGLPAGVVIAAALAVALAVCGVAMHLFTEKPAIQVLIGFTIFFVFMMIALFRLGISDKIGGTEHGAFDVVTTTGDAH